MTLFKYLDIRDISSSFYFFNRCNQTFWAITNIGQRKLTVASHKMGISRYLAFRT